MIRSPCQWIGFLCCSIRLVLEGCGFRFLMYFPNALFVIVWLLFQCVFFLYFFPSFSWLCSMIFSPQMLNVPRIFRLLMLFISSKTQTWAINLMQKFHHRLSFGLFAFFFFFDLSIWCALNFGFVFNERTITHLSIYLVFSQLYAFNMFGSCLSTLFFIVSLMREQRYFGYSCYVFSCFICEALLMYHILSFMLYTSSVT